MANTVIIPFFDIEVSVNTLLGIALFLIIFFTFFSVSFELNMGESNDTNLACNRRKPEETDGDGVNRSSWLSGLGLSNPTKDGDDPEKGVETGDEGNSLWF